MFFKQKVFCPVCHLYMFEVKVDQVPAEAKREFARLNKYHTLSLKGWYWCTECNYYMHQPTVDKLKS